MKKLFYLLLALPLALLASCSKEEVAPFNMTLTMGNVTTSGTTFYAVQGEDVTIEGLEVQATGNSKTDVANVMFYLDGMPLLGIPGAPFNGTFSTANIPAGQHTIGVSGTLLQVDHSLKTIAVNYPFTIVESQDDLPSGADDLGTYGVTISVSNSD